MFPILSFSCAIALLLLAGGPLQGPETEMAMSEDQKPTIVIVGAGIAGLTLALGLSKTGNYNIEIVERRKDLTSQGAAFSLAPNGAKALNEVISDDGKLEEEMRQIGIIFPNGPYNVVLLPWWAMRDALLKRVLETKRIKLHTGCEVDEIVDDPTESCVTVGCSNTALKVKGSLVIGADGVNSAVRRCLGRTSAKPSGAVGWRGHASVSNNPFISKFLEENPGATPISVRHTPVLISCFSFLPKTDILCWVISTQDEELAKTVKSPLDSFRILKDFVEDPFKWKALEELRDMTNEDTASSFKIKIQDMSDEGMEGMGSGWGGKGRVLLLGDAAHALRPASGQGGNMALEDCACLFRILNQNDAVDSLKNYESCNEMVVNAFESSRLRRVRTIHEDQTRQSTSAYGKTGYAGWTDEFRDWVYKGI